MGAHAGISVGPDGATHQALEDIAITRVLPNMTVIVPCDAEEARKATIAAGDINGPVYIRFGREKTPVMTTKSTPFKVGRAEVCVKGTDVTILACGSLLYEALVAAHLMRVGQTPSGKKIFAEVINVHTVKPLDTKTICASAGRTGCVVTVEEHQINGGFGGAAAEALGRACPVPMEFVGMQNTFGESGTTDELLTAYGMKAKNIIEAVEKVLVRHHGRAPKSVKHK